MHRVNLSNKNKQYLGILRAHICYCTLFIAYFVHGVSSDSAQWPSAERELSITVFLLGIVCHREMKCKLLWHKVARHHGK